MNHDYAHCWEYEKGVCPMSCFRAVITEDLKNWPRPVVFSHFKDSNECPLTHPKPKPTHADRIRAMTDEELAEFLCESRFTCGNCPAAEFCKDGHIGFIDWLKQPEESEVDNG